MFVLKVLRVARWYVIDVYAGSCLHSERRATDEEQQSMIKRAARVPSKPACPVAECDRGIYMTVTWTRPEDDGEGDITAYVIKYGGEDTNVDDYATVNVVGDTTSFTFTDQLEEKTEYQFAVAAVNTAGQGEFSEFSDYVKTDRGK